MSGHDLREEPDRVAVGSEKIHDGLEVEDLVLTVDGGASDAITVRILYAAFLRDLQGKTLAAVCCGFPELQ